MKGDLGPRDAVRDPTARRLGARRVAPDEDQRGALARQRLGRLEPDPGGRAGDEAGLALHVRRPPESAGWVFHL